MNNRLDSPRLREVSGSNIQIECQKDRGFLHLFIFGGRDKPFAAKEIMFEEIGLYEQLPTALTINETEAQGLMESLWKAGIRPRSGEGSVGQLGATERHLADMRAIVAKHTKTELK